MTPTPVTYRIYHGSSMRAVFTPGDLLEINPQPIQQVQAGDILVYQVGKDLEVVHRAIRQEPHGWVTRGDNNLAEDPILVTEEMLVGKVKQHLPISSTPKRRSLVMRAITRTRRRPELQRAGLWFYRWFKNTGWVRRLWNPGITVLSLQVGGKQVYKYLHDGRTVASWDPKLDQFSCCHPYDLVIQRPGRVE